ncbi:hypothetical protein J437_LFUL016153, partial [Ladona fulva]
LFQAVNHCHVKFQPSGISTSASQGNFAAFEDSKTKGEQNSGPNLLLGGSGWDGVASSFTPPSTGGSIPRNASTPNLESRARDPFADLGNIGGISGWSGSKPTTPRAGSPSQAGSGPFGGSPQHILSGGWQQPPQPSTPARTP